MIGLGSDKNYFLRLCDVELLTMFQRQGGDKDNRKGGLLASLLKKYST